MRPISWSNIQKYKTSLSKFSLQYTNASLNTSWAPSLKRENRSSRPSDEQQYAVENGVPLYRASLNRKKFLDPRDTHILFTVPVITPQIPSASTSLYIYYSPRRYRRCMLYPILNRRSPAIPATIKLRQFQMYIRSVMAYAGAQHASP